MPMSLITDNNTIRARHSVREDFAGVSTGSGRTSYYISKGHALRTFEGVLEYYGLCFDSDDDLFTANSNGRIIIPICMISDGYVEDGNRDDIVGFASLSWHRMESGRYEFTGYIT